MTSAFSKSELRQLIQQAGAVLTANNFGNATKPAPSLYPHQWNWDSAFIAIGLSHLNQVQAQREISAMFRGQWKNGMVPHIIFNPTASDYFPGPAFWASRINPAAPDNILTSGITQPPILAWAALQIYYNAGDTRSALDFLRSIYPRLCRYHSFFHTNRNPDGNGLVYIIHPWESGLDNSPRWDQIMEGIVPKEAQSVLRTDVNIIAENERPTDHEYNKYSYLVDLFRKTQYDQGQILQESPFIVQPVLFNSLLYVDLEARERIDTLLGADTGVIKAWRGQLKVAIQTKLWDETSGSFGDYDLKNRRLFLKDTLANYAPLFTGIPSQAVADRLIARLFSSEQYWPDSGFPLTSVSMAVPEFDPVKYWRGPVWINMNWLMIQGLQKYGYHSQAKELTEKTITLIRDHGFYEYFNPLTGAGCGTDQFSWTAALLIDLIMKYLSTGAGINEETPGSLVNE
ncbi:MAG: glycoside hydrolase [Candidatus Marinimicrobia bacterium]|nr:glycoside hydrolase [Candidatus Neomarinimicrobiota bacterium]